MRPELEPRAVQLPAQAAEWKAQCLRVLDQTPVVEHTELFGGFGIDWFETGALREPQDGLERERHVWLSPHSDDMEFKGAATLRKAVQEGHDVSEILFTGGAYGTGRESRGFEDDADFPRVRLAEAILGARELGIHRLGIITIPDGTRGFQEWMWNAHDPQMRPVWISIMRTLNPHVVYSPYPDEDVDGHPDHVEVAEVAKWMVGWGTENDFYSRRIPGRATAFKEWWRYGVWSGEKTLPVNHRVKFDIGSPLAEMRRRALEWFVTQNGVGYADIGDGMTVMNGGLPHVGDGGKLQGAEVFNISRPTTETSVTYIP